MTCRSSSNQRQPPSVEVDDERLAMAVAERVGGHSEELAERGVRVELQDPLTCAGWTSSTCSTAGRILRDPGSNLRPV
jgi:hypothetical protein